MAVAGIIFSKNLSFCEVFFRIIFQTPFMGWYRYISYSLLWFFINFEPRRALVWKSVMFRLGTTALLLGGARRQTILRKGACFMELRMSVCFMELCMGVTPRRDSIAPVLLWRHERKDHSCVPACYPESEKGPHNKRMKYADACVLIRYLWGEKEPHTNCMRFFQFG